MKTVLKILFVISLGLSATAVPVTDSCVAQFQELLNQTMEAKEHCEGAAAFVDCCQVK